MHAGPHYLERQVEDSRDFLTALARKKMLQDKILILCKRRRQNAPLSDSSMCEFTCSHTSLYFLSAKGLIPELKFVKVS
jgi:hypothetical protein